MIIHFVCSGNCYRSRLSEAYLNSKNITGIKATSSGTHAKKSSKGQICWYTKQVLEENRILKHTSKSWKKTTKEHLKEASLIIFMEDIHYEFCQKNLKFDQNKYEIWGINDVEKYGLYDKDLSKESDLKRVKVTRKTFKLIKEKVDDLLRRLQKN